MKRLLRGLGPNVVALGFASFFTDCAAEMIFPLLPFFLTDVLKASKTMVGLIEGAADSLSSLLRIVSGRLSDVSRKRKPFILWGYAISVIARPLFGLATAAWHVLSIRLLDRVGKGTRLAARDALIADSCESWARGKAFGFQNAMDHFGAAVGPLVAYALLRWSGLEIRQVFLWTAFPAAAVVVVIALFVKDVPGHSDGTVTKLTLQPFDRNFNWFLATIFVFTLANSSDAFILLRGAACGIENRDIPLVWCMLSVIRMLAGLPAGILADRLDRRYVVLAGLAVFIVTYASLPFARTPAQYLAIVAFYGLFHALCMSVLRALVADLVPRELRGTAYGMFHFSIGIASLPSSLVFGWLYQHKGATPAFLTSTVLASVAGLMLLAVRPKPSATTSSPVKST